MRTIDVSRPRSHNALKHGGYANLGVLPGEDPAEFDRFHESLIVEFEPSGPTECDVVLDLAKSLWRKSRLTIYARAAKARKDCELVFEDRDSPNWDLNTGIIKGLARDLERLPKVAAVAAERQKVDQELIGHLTEWKNGLVACGWLDAKREQDFLRESRLELRLAEMGDQITEEGLTREIELYARLEARIDRLLKRLFQLKAAKQMSGLGSRKHDAPSPVRTLLSSAA